MDSPTLLAVVVKLGLVSVKVLYRALMVSSVDIDTLRQQATVIYKSAPDKIDAAAVSGNDAAVVIKTLVDTGMLLIIHDDVEDDNDTSMGVVAPSNIGKSVESAHSGSIAKYSTELDIVRMSALLDQISSGHLDIADIRFDMTPAEIQQSDHLAEIFSIVGSVAENISRELPELSYENVSSFAISAGSDAGNTLVSAGRTVGSTLYNVGSVILSPIKDATADAAATAADKVASAANATISKVADATSTAAKTVAFYLLAGGAAIYLFKSSADVTAAKYGVPLVAGAAAIVYYKTM